MGNPDTSSIEPTPPSTLVTKVADKGGVVDLMEPEFSGDTDLEAFEGDVEKKGKAYSLFLKNNLNVSEIAIALSVPVIVVASWIRRGGWRKRKQDLQVELMRDVEAQYVEFLRKTKLETLLRQMELGKTLETKLQQLLDEATKGDRQLSSQELDRIARAYQATATVTARLVGLRDITAPTMESEVVGGDGKTGKPPLVVVLGQMPEGSHIQTAEGTSTRIDGGGR